MPLSNRLAAAALALVALVASPARAQPLPEAPTDAEVVAVQPVWKRGASWPMQHTKTLLHTRGADTLVASEVRTRYLVTVEEVGPDGAILRWLPQQSTRQALDESTEMAIAEITANPDETLLRLARDGYRLRFDADGAYQGIANIDDIARLVARMLERPDTLYSRLSAEQRAAFVAMMTRLQRPEVVEQFVGELFNVHHQFHGYTITTGVREIIPDTVDVPLFGVKLPVDVVLETTRLSSGTIRVRYKRAIRPDILRRLVERHPLFATMDPAARREALNSSDAAVTRLDEAAWFIDVHTGIVVASDARSTVFMTGEDAPITQITTHRIRRAR